MARYPPHTLELLRFLHQCTFITCPQASSKLVHRNDDSEKLRWRLALWFDWQALQEKSNITVSRKGDASRAVITIMKTILWPPQSLHGFIQAYYVKHIRSIMNVTFRNGSYTSKGRAYPVWWMSNHSELRDLRSEGIHFKNKHKLTIRKSTMMPQIKEEFVGSEHKY
jgi:hypothetical protein